MKPISTMRLAVLLPLVFAAGCYINVQDNNDPHHHSGDDWEDPGPTSPYLCQDNSECRAGEYCLRGECVLIAPGATACTTSAQCNHREYCINGYCSELCAKDADCGAGAVCHDNYCVGAPTTDGGSSGGNPGADAGTGGSASCVRHSDCGTGAYCINAVCYLGCQGDLDCPSTEQCEAGICHPRPAGSQPSCTSGAQCQDGEDCVDGTCRATCSVNTDCVTGQSCVIGYCTPNAPPPDSGNGCP